jgi:FkbM family methyltransferase
MSKIAVHHVGGRWGNQPFPISPPFEDDFVVVLYEADTDAIAGLRDAWADKRTELIIQPFCLADAEGNALLHIYSNPGLTSLRPFGTTLLQRYLHLFGVDFDFDGAGTRLLERREIETRTLDNLARAPGSALPPPDFLSLDVQGSEYEVLGGAENTLQNAVLGLVVEVEFAEMYAGQKRFQDICDFLGQRGFDFVRFLSLGEASGPAAPLGFRLGGYQSWADALFLRRPETLSSLPDEDAQLRKLCFMAIGFANMELAIECIRRLPTRASEHPAKAPTLAYERLVSGLKRAYDLAEKFYPPVFSEILPEHRMLDYARAANIEEWPAIFEGLKQFDQKYLTALEALQRTEDTEVESLLRRYEFNDQADRLNFTRRHQAHNIMQAIRAARQAS